MNLTYKIKNQMEFFKHFILEEQSLPLYSIEVRKRLWTMDVLDMYFLLKRHEEFIS